MSKILIRADGGKEIGLGHIMRTLVLAKELRKYFEVYYLCKDNEILYSEGIKKIIDEGFNVIKIDENNLISDIKKIQNEIEADLLITDSYDVNETYFDEMKKVFKVSGYIDDVNICRLNVDFIINQNINANDIKYKANKDTKLFLGPKYCLLREEFRKQIDKKIKKNVNDILITVGGSDKDYNTLKLLSMLEECKVKIHVVIGSAFEEKLIEELYNKHYYKTNIKLYRNANMSSLMKLSDVAISSCGSTLYELCAMKVPTIGIVVANNQKDVCKKFNDLGVIVGTGDLINNNINKLSEITYNLIEDNMLRYNLSLNQKEIVNVNGKLLLSKEIINLINIKTLYL